MQPIVNVLGAAGRALLVGLWQAPVLTLHAAEAAKPNVMIILADDMGFSDASCYGGEIATPNLDALARDGLRFTQFYNTTRCWPSRASTWCGSARSASGPLGPQTRRQQADVRAAAAGFVLTRQQKEADDG